jgi:hypothetical protein
LPDKPCTAATDPISAIWPIVPFALKAEVMISLLNNDPEPKSYFNAFSSIPKVIDYLGW